MGSSFNIKDVLDNIDNEVDQEAFSLWGSNAGMGAMSGTEIFESPKFKQIVFILIANPILVQPTLNFLMLKQAQISKAQLEVLYTPEELETMYTELKLQSDNGG